MVKTTFEQYRGELLKTGGYTTPEERRSPVRAKPGALTTLRFSLRASRVFPLCALYELFGMLTQERWARFCFSTVQVAEAMGMNVLVEGFKNRAGYDGPVIYLCNHMSTFETILLPTILQAYGDFNTVVKASLSHLPFLEKAAVSIGLVPVSRKSPKEDLMNILKVGVDCLNSGKSFLVFPQGSREKTFSRRMYSSIGAKLAERAKVPVCPIVVDTRCQPTREKGLLAKVFKDFGPVDTSKDVRCCCGPMIRAEKSREMHEAAFDWMAGKLEDWGLPVER